MTVRTQQILAGAQGGPHLPLAVLQLLLGGLLVLGGGRGGRLGLGFRQELDDNLGLGSGSDLAVRLEPLPVQVLRALHSLLPLPPVQLVPSYVFHVLAFF